MLDGRLCIDLFLDPGLIGNEVEMRMYNANS